MLARPRRPAVTRRSWLPHCECARTRSNCRRRHGTVATVASLQPAYDAALLSRTISESRACKARLLHYFPLDNMAAAHSNDADYASWCGWHLDHGSLTGLTSAMYLDAQGNVVPNRDPNSGLFIRSRGNAVTRVLIPEDCLAFQVRAGPDVGGAVAHTALRMTRAPAPRTVSAAGRGRADRHRWPASRYLALCARCRGARHARRVAQHVRGVHAAVRGDGARPAHPYVARVPLRTAGRQLNGVAQRPMFRMLA